MMIDYNEILMPLLVRNGQQSSEGITGVPESERNIYNHNHPITGEVELRKLFPEPVIPGFGRYNCLHINASLNQPITRPFSSQMAISIRVAEQND